MRSHLARLGRSSPIWLSRVSSPEVGIHPQPPASAAVRFRCCTLNDRRAFPTFHRCSPWADAAFQGRENKSKRAKLRGDARCIESLLALGVRTGVVHSPFAPRAPAQFHDSIKAKSCGSSVQYLNHHAQSEATHQTALNLVKSSLGKPSARRGDHLEGCKITFPAGAELGCPAPRGQNTPRRGPVHPEFQPHPPSPQAYLQGQPAAPSKTLGGKLAGMSAHPAVTFSTSHSHVGHCFLVPKLRSRCFTSSATGSPPGDSHACKTNEEPRRRGGDLWRAMSLKTWLNSLASVCKAFMVLTALFFTTSRASSLTRKYSTDTCVLDLMRRSKISLFVALIKNKVSMTL